MAGKQVTGVVASYRRMGNSEVLVKAALNAARSAGAAVKLIRLSDYSLLPCDGCMSCVFKSHRAKSPRDPYCSIKDDAPKLLGEIVFSDGLILGAPTYVLSPSSVIKLLIDRAMMFYPVLYGRETEPLTRWAATICVAGVRGWDDLSQPLLNQLPLSLGFELAGSMTAYAPGPAQVLVDPDNVQRAERLGKMVVIGEREQRPERSCPVCYSRFFLPLQNGVFQCPVCEVRGRLVDRGGHIKFEPEPAELSRHRWSVKRMREHFIGWISRTRELYLKDRELIRAARKPFEDLEF